MGCLKNRNNVIFTNHKCNHVEIIKQIKHTYHCTILYNKITNTSTWVTMHGMTNMSKVDWRQLKTGTPSFKLAQVKHRASRITAKESSAISYACRDTKVQIHHLMCKAIVMFQLLWQRWWRFERQLGWQFNCN